MARRSTSSTVSVPAQPTLPEPQRWLVIDPSSVPHQIGWAYFEQGALLHCGNLGRLRGTHLPLVRFGHILTEGAALIQRLRPDQLIIEDQFLGNNPKTLRVLTAAKMLWITMALQAQLPVIEVTPAEWQRMFQAAWAFGLKREQLFPHIEAALRREYPHLPAVLDPNMLCAIAIGMARLRQPVPVPSPPRPRRRRRRALSS